MVINDFLLRHRMSIRIVFAGVCLFMSAFGLWGQTTPIYDKYIRYGIFISDNHDGSFVFSPAAAMEVRIDRLPWQLSDSVRKWHLGLTGFDSSIVQIHDSIVIPLHIGKTPIIVNYPMYADTVSIVVVNHQEKLWVDFDIASLHAARYPKYYHSLFVDTMGASRRLESYRSITQGMNYSMVAALFGDSSNAAYLYSSSPKTYYWIIDEHRKLYISFVGDIVEKVWLNKD